MTNSCYSYRVYNMYRVGADPVKLNLYCRKRTRNRLFHKGRIYWFSHDVLREIHEIYTTVIWKIHRLKGRAPYRIHCVMHRIMRFMRIVCKVAKLEAPILAAFTALYVKALLYGRAMIALIN